jgi:CDP-diacylglycerol---serine O-phosphatidyltransferase
MSDRPPFSPIRRLRRYRPRPRNRRRFKGPSFNRIVPNLMTMLGLCAGLTSMRFGLEGRFGAAAVAIAVAALIDGLDGRLARLLKATSRFGAELEARSLGLGWLLDVAKYPLFNAVVLIGTALLLVSTLPI